MLNKHTHAQSPLTLTLSPSDEGRPGRGANVFSILKTSVILCGLGASLLTGCATGGAKPPINTTKYDLENRAHFVLMDSRTQRSVTCMGIQERPLDDGRLQVAANVRNRLNRRIQVQINCEFKDEQGFPVDSTPWQTLILTENAQESVAFTAMNNKARKYTIRVREAR
ncbi:MAG: YcfL family protein [Verrucomicrobia bacterium]|nr:YcfL family protein [Verrucomicrobiota bacterium]